MHIGVHCYYGGVDNIYICAAQGVAEEILKTIPEEHKDKLKVTFKDGIVSKISFPMTEIQNYRLVVGIGEESYLGRFPDLRPCGHCGKIGEAADYYPGYRYRLEEIESHVEYNGNYVEIR